MKEMYKISGYYFAGEERTPFEALVFAIDNMTAMTLVVGKLAWNVSLEGRSFKLDTIHYECL